MPWLGARRAWWETNYDLVLRVFMGSCLSAQLMQSFVKGLARRRFSSIRFSQPGSSHGRPTIASPIFSIIACSRRASSTTEAVAAITNKPAHAFALSPISPRRGSGYVANEWCTCERVETPRPVCDMCVHLQNKEPDHIIHPMYRKGQAG